VLVELSVVEQRYHAVMEVLAGGVSVSEVAERYGVSRQSVHTWVRRCRAEGLAGLSDRSHRPAYQPRQLAAEVEAQLPGGSPRPPRSALVQCKPCARYTSSAQIQDEYSTSALYLVRLVAPWVHRPRTLTRSPYFCCG
jgi:transposase-like protein